MPQPITDLLTAVKPFIDFFEVDERAAILSHIGNNTEPSDNLLRKIYETLRQQSQALTRLVDSKPNQVFTYWAGPNKYVHPTTYQPHFHPNFDPVLIPLTRNGKPYPVILERWDYEEARTQLMGTKGFSELTSYSRYLKNIKSSEEPFILIARNLQGTIDAFGIRVLYETEGIKRVAFVRGVKFDREKTTEIKMIGIAINMALMRHLKKSGIWHDEEKGPLIEGIVPPLLAKWRERLGYAGPLIWDDSLGADEIDYYLNRIGLQFIDIPKPESRIEQNSTNENSIRKYFDNICELLSDLYDEFKSLADKYITKSSELDKYDPLFSSLQRIGNSLIMSHRVHPVHLSPLFRLGITTDDFTSYKFKPFNVEVLYEGQPVTARVDLITPHEALFVLDGDLRDAIRSYAETGTAALIFTVSIDGKVIAISANELTTGALNKPQLNRLNTLSIEAEAENPKYKRLSFALMLARLRYFIEHNLLDQLEPDDPLIKNIEQYIATSWRRLADIHTNSNLKNQATYTTWSIGDALKCAEVWNNLTQPIQIADLVPADNSLKISSNEQLLEMIGSDENIPELTGPSVQLEPWVFTAPQMIFSGSNLVR